jgi:hypothetical protein
MRPAAQIRTLPVRDGWATPEHIARAKQRMVAETPYMAVASKPKPTEPLIPKELPAPPAADDPSNPSIEPRGEKLPARPQKTATGVNAGTIEPCRPQLLQRSARLDLRGEHRRATGSRRGTRRSFVLPRCTGSSTPTSSLD